MEKLSELEMWLEEEGFDEPKYEYTNRTALIEDMIKPIINRQKEHRLRGDLVGKLKEQVSFTKEKVEGFGELKPWISDEDKLPFLEKINEIDLWL